MSKKAKVLYDENLAGFISETDEGYEFVYDTNYLNESPRPVSLTLPLQEESFKSKVLFAFFDGLIPEGWLLDIATEHWKVKANDRFGLLLLACRDAIGAVSIVPENE
ncbi:MAG: HipA N-terminal domain-containing protein [Chitinophagaceae bacterium]|nr:HipA N-terminal domain-containing protein [Chitinophagaceae bacterium]MDP1763616.1 HipA N-terminal domain-containing protein [Sediminibacterium sp.]MDP1811364.1 HipA N-terminal domain-containing protein [Sediminibacterium sp.]MDP3127122.1 HipA N-terminal domain-containing protein [Sediminibacterium sp.]MDP3666720.1 HipA N-terminal domain-containing protein [Sediminibacterium sp.]